MKISIEILVLSDVGLLNFNFRILLDPFLDDFGALIERQAKLVGDVRQCHLQKMKFLRIWSRGSTHLDLTFLPSSSTDVEMKIWTFLRVSALRSAIFCEFFGGECDTNNKNS